MQHFVNFVVNKMNKQKNPNFKKNKKKGASPLIELVSSVFVNNPTLVMNYKQISKRLNLNVNEARNNLPGILKVLKDRETIAEVGPGRYRAKNVGGNITGTVDMTRSGYAFIKTDDMEDDVFISASNLNMALNGDKVKVRLFAKRRGARPEGEVVEILERSKSTFVGTVELVQNFAFLTCDSRNMPFDLFIPQGKLKGAKQGQKAIARITQWDKKAKNPVAEIIEVLGDPGLHETEINAIMAEFELPIRFDEEVERAAEKIDKRIPEDEIKRRRDFRNVPTFTIDPDDAKDFDDALSFRRLDNGNIEAGVHIADVTYYIKPDTILENEAKTRATSVYLVDRVVPMLPEKISNDVCSLNANETKLTYAAVFELNDKAEIISEWFGRTVINSDKRFSYAEAQMVIDTGDGPMKDGVLALHDLAQKLRTKRFKTGAFAFDRVEVKFDLDEKGKPLAIKFRETGTANQLVEEFMLLANRRVAEFVGKKGRERTFVYRIHDTPDPEKVSAFSHFIKRFGYKLEVDADTNLPKRMNTLLKEVAGKKEQNIIETLALRSMAKAVYSTDNIGHYGLAFKYYTHFTSPIRRYPDMMVHRLLTHYLDGGKSPDVNPYTKMCEYSSKMERLATEAERASVKYKQVEFMSDKLGQVFDGVISGVTEWGIYVEIIENHCEGMVHIRELSDDYFEYDEENYCIKGKKSGRCFMLGDRVSILVVKADLEKKQLDFKIAENID